MPVKKENPSLLKQVLGRRHSHVLKDVLNQGSGRRLIVDRWAVPNIPHAIKSFLMQGGEGRIEGCQLYPM